MNCRYSFCDRVFDSDVHTDECPRCKQRREAKETISQPEQRCSDCGKRYRGPHPPKFEPPMCPRCKGEFESDPAYRNVDPTSGERSVDYFTFRHGGRGIPLFKR